VAKKIFIREFVAYKINSCHQDTRTLRFTKKILRAALCLSDFVAKKFIHTFMAKKLSIGSIEIDQINKFSLKPKENKI